MKVISVEATEDLAKLANSIGITGVTAEDQPAILKKLSELTGINVSSFASTPFIPLHIFTSFILKYSNVI